MYILYYQSEHVIEYLVGMKRSFVQSSPWIALWFVGWWCCAFMLCLGTAYVAISGIAFLYRFTTTSYGTVPASKTTWSAYSVFNRGVQRLPGDRDQVPQLY